LVYLSKNGKLKESTLQEKVARMAGNNRKEKFMKINTIIISCLFVLASSVSLAGYTHWVCQDCDPYMHPRYDTITKAIEAAAPGDTIRVVAEEFPPGGGHIIEYSEAVTIDKPLTLECRSIHPVLGQPVITIDDYKMANSVITITNEAAGSIISNLHIRGPKSDNTTCKDDPIKHVNEQTGLSIQADQCRLDACTITHCMTGILIDTGNTGQKDGIQINECTIGQPFVGVVNEYWVKEENWTRDHQGHPIDHPGNGYGIVILESPSVSTHDPDAVWYKIKNSTIQSSRYAPVVFPPHHVIMTTP
jgi:hypothetical protein